MQNGLYADDLKVSYDSTSTLKAFMTGRYSAKDGRFLRMLKEIECDTHRVMAEEVNELFGTEYTAEQMYYFNTTNSKQHVENDKKNNTQRQYIEFINKLLATMSTNQMRLVEQYFTDRASLEALFKKEKLDNFAVEFYDVKTEADFNYAMKQATLIRSNAVPVKKAADLQDFFL
jgi:hypothetical protein